MSRFRFLLVGRGGMREIDKEFLSSKLISNLSAASIASPLSSPPLWLLLLLSFPPGFCCEPPRRSSAHPAYKNISAVPFGQRIYLVGRNYPQTRSSVRFFLYVKDLIFNYFTNFLYRFNIVHFIRTFLKFKFFRFVSEIYHLKPPLYVFNSSISKPGTNVKTKCLLYCPFCAIC